MVVNIKRILINCNFQRTTGSEGLQVSYTQLKIKLMGLQECRLPFVCTSALCKMQSGCDLSSKTTGTGRVNNQSTKPGLQKFGFINGVDNVNWPPYRDSKS